MNIAISSGKGGTGKTFISTNIAAVLAQKGQKVRYLDCDVEEPNGHLFLKPVIHKEEDITLIAPCGAEEEKCIKCGKCVDTCRYNAIAMVNEKVLFFKELCHVCGGCEIVCPVGAIIKKDRKIGVMKHGKAGSVDVHYALLETAEGGMSPRLVKKVKESAKEGINILDSPPGTACPVVETVKEADLCVLVTDPTPFGMNDLKLAVDMARQIGQEPVIIVNRSEYHNDELKIYCREEELEVAGEIPDDRKIAEVYSRGDVVVEKLPQYRELFEKIASGIIELAGDERFVKKNRASKTPYVETKKSPEKAELYSTPPGGDKPKEIVVISGKGGTGKTSIAASFAALAENMVISDCDVDASDLFLVLDPVIRERGDFSGGIKVEIDKNKCNGCGRCQKVCRFSAIGREVSGDKKYFTIDPLACEGCGVCSLVCEESAVRVEDAINGEWFISDTRFGPMSHAKMFPGEENSGKLVNLVKNKAALLAHEFNINNELIDGSPGTGCPVIASLTGAGFALIVTEPTISGLHDMVRVVEVTKHFGISTGVIVNKYDLNVNIAAEIKKLSAREKIEFLGQVPYDKAVTLAQMEKLSVVEFSSGEAAKNIQEIWNKVSSIFSANRRT